MSVNKCIKDFVLLMAFVAFEEHNKDCKEQLGIFTIKTGDCIRVELCCDKCGRRYVHDIYKLTEVD